MEKSKEVYRFFSQHKHKHKHKEQLVSWLQLHGDIKLYERQQQ